MRLRYRLLLLILLAVVVYLPGLKAGYFVFDDSDIVFALQGKAFDLSGIFAGDTGTYWRPLTIATYLLDAALWDLDPAIMHLENILLHALNTLLVYTAARTILEDDPHDIPLLAAALFTLHPVNTEAVNWISGRTDPLAAFFSLMGICLLLRWKKDQTKIGNCYAAGFFFFLGCLAKEVAFGMFVGTIFFCVIHMPGDDGRRPNSLTRFHAIIPFLIFALLYLKSRAMVFSTNDHGLEKVVSKTLDTPLLPQIGNALTALGFYVKKLLVPTPLAFAIDNISSHYLWLGGAVVLAALAILILRNKPAALFLLVLTGIAPALLNAVHQIAWTAYAERYLYLPAAVAVLAVCALLRPLPGRRTAELLLLGVLFLYYLPVTMQRNLLWADQAGFLELAVEQAPDNVMLRNNYGVVLATFGKLDEARRQFTIAAEYDPSNELIKINQSKYGEKVSPTSLRR